MRVTADVPGPAPVISLRHATFGYGGRAVTSDLTLDVVPGEVVALLGPNGSGKSTLVKGLLGLNDHLGGDVELFGHALDRPGLRTRLGYVPQRHTLSASVRSTVREVVATGRLAHRPWWRPAGSRDRERVAQAVDLVGLSERADSDVAALSGGQQRRVLIARALAGDPEVLVMDEPTAGVDAASQDVLGGVLRRLAETGVTMMVVTHELGSLRGVVARIVAMDGGHICFDGSPQAYAVHRRGEGHRHSGHDGGHHHDDAVHAPYPGPGVVLGSGPFEPAQRRERG